MKEPVIDWMELTLMLRKYQSYRQMSEYTGIAAATIRKISRGEVEQPKFDGGLKLLDLAHDYVPDNSYVKWR